ncbi:MAG TPA: RtcB family protein [Tepidisphaeraceae bacterium]|jgi:tRNA-splicing ligase RtcB|nr:RtcB family protein [Tepidisphaeraceae bacterium]
MKDSRLIRLDATRLKIANDQNVDATLFANEQVPVESGAVDELVGMIGLADTVDRLAKNDAGFFDRTPEISKIAVTPDFHKGVGIPIGTVMATRGFVVPQAIGNDINCGMRLHVTSLKADEILPNLDVLETRCRHTYFEGGRNIPMSRVQRQGMFQEGLPGLLSAVPKSQSEGLWSLFHELIGARELEHVHAQGMYRAGGIFGLDDFLGKPQGMNRDGQIGSIGGGNHFVEIQRIARILDGATAHAWGLKEGMVTLMIHSGSLSIGHHCGSHFRDVMRRVFPANLRHPENGIFLLPVGDRHRDALDLFWDAMSNAANFAFANRMFLALMAVQSLRGVVGSFDVSLLYDAPHNLVWKEEMEGEPVFLHRKGACPSRGFEEMQNTPFAYYGEPVLVPGSMGASSYILAGRGNADSLWSASHGAGRAMSRGDALRASDAEFAAFMKKFRVVTPVDLRRPDIQMRRDIVEKKLEDIKKEAPFAYKGIGPIINTLTEANIAQPVVELTPLMTIKG